MPFYFTPKVPREWFNFENYAHMTDAELTEKVLCHPDYIEGFYDKGLQDEDLETDGPMYVWASFDGIEFQPAGPVCDCIMVREYTREDKDRHYVIIDLDTIEGDKAAVLYVDSSEFEWDAEFAQTEKLQRTLDFSKNVAWDDPEFLDLLQFAGEQFVSSFQVYKNMTPYFKEKMNVE